MTEIINDNKQQAKKLLINNQKKLDKVAKRLLEVETLSRTEFEKIFPPPIEKNSGVPTIAT